MVFEAQSQNLWDALCMSIYVSCSTAVIQPQNKTRVKVLSCNFLIINNTVAPIYFRNVQHGLFMWAVASRSFNSNMAPRIKSSNCGIRVIKQYCKQDVYQGHANLRISISMMAQAPPLARSLTQKKGLQPGRRKKKEMKKEDKS